MNGGKRGQLGKKSSDCRSQPHRKSPWMIFNWGGKKGYKVVSGRNEVRFEDSTRIFHPKTEDHAARMPTRNDLTWQAGI